MGVRIFKYNMISHIISPFLVVYFPRTTKTSQRRGIKQNSRPWCTLKMYIVCNDVVCITINRNRDRNNIRNNKTQLLFKFKSSESCHQLHSFDTLLVWDSWSIINFSVENSPWKIKHKPLNSLLSFWRINWKVNKIEWQIHYSNWYNLYV